MIQDSKGVQGKVWPARVTPGRPNKQEGPTFEPWFPKVRCGVPDCGAVVAEVWCYDNEIHTIHFYPGFTLQDGILTLAPRYARQWERERRQRVPWTRFLARGRRQNVPPPGTRTWLDPMAWTVAPFTVHGGGTFLFRCPVCREHPVSKVTVPRSCAPPGYCALCPDPN